MSILVVAAHPDDEVLGCGGTIARWAKDGREIHIGILGEGITSRTQNREDSDFSQVDELHSKSYKAGKLWLSRRVLLSSARR